MIDIKNLSFNYSRKKALVLDDFSLSIGNGGVYGLLGPNGVGKSTLLYLISGLLTPLKGSCLINGINSRLRYPDSIRRIFLVPEEFEFPAISLQKYVEIHAPFYPDFDYDDMKHSLSLFGLEDNINLGALSMGQRKKAMMAFALACNTPIVLMDEPTNGLDIPGKAMFRRLIAEKASAERLFIISTHQVRDLDSLLDHIIIMNQQQVLLNASTEEIQKRVIFEITNDPEVINSALHSLPGIGGTSVMLQNKYDEDTRLNLEILFDFAFANPQKLSTLFNNPTNTEEL
ncbi:MAG: ABC transporter ATP-binding protein [Muribaculaceae bacterium]|nr:ABC transporter ATP-binding protein [Muribaculaceae bacterium]